MQSLQSILSTRNFTPPAEMEIIRAYVQRKYSSACIIKVQREAIMITVPNSALASTLRLEQQALIKACGLTKKLIIRIGR